MKNFKKTISIILCLVMTFSICPIMSSAAVCTTCGGTDHTPSIIIPGLFQCESFAYDENGEKLLDSDGNVREAPFFLDTNDIIKDAVTTALIPLAETLIYQKDGNEKFANALGHVLGDALFGVIKSDSEGNLVNDVRAVKYDTSYAGMNDHDKNKVLSSIPLQKYISVAGEDHLYFFSYFSLDNLTKIATELKDLIYKVKEETGHDKVNIVPISQGGSIFDMCLELYPDIVDDIDRIVYIVPAADGANTLGDFFVTGLLDDDDALYDYMFTNLLAGKDESKEWLGYLISMLIRIFPKEDLKNILSTAVEILIKDYLVNVTTMWALVPSDGYPIAREKYLMGEEHDKVREQTDRYYQAQLNVKDNILRAIEHGVTFFDLCGYNTNLYPIVDSWDQVSADGIIQLSSTSFGAYSIKKDTQLPEGYVQQNTSPLCKDPEHHNHIDPYNLVDASTGLLADNTFYFYGHSHEQTASCDIVIDLTVKLLTDNSFTDVYSYPEIYPQFNNFRNSRKLLNATDELRKIDKSKLSDEEIAQVDAAIAESEAVLAQTVVDLERYEASLAQVNGLVEKIKCINSDEYAANAQQEAKKTSIFRILSKLFAFINKLLRRFIGDKGFSDR